MGATMALTSELVGSITVIISWRRVERRGKVSGAGRETMGSGDGVSSVGQPEKHASVVSLRSKAERLVTVMLVDRQVSSAFARRR